MKGSLVYGSRGKKEILAVGSAVDLVFSELQTIKTL